MKKIYTYFNTFGNAFRETFDKINEEIKNLFKQQDEILVFDEPIQTTTMDLITECRLDYSGNPAFVTENEDWLYWDNLPFFVIEEIIGAITTGSYEFR